MSNKAVIAFLAAIVLAAVLMAMPSLFRKPAKDLVPWNHSFDAVVGQGKPILVDFTADWCPPCQELKRTVFSRNDVASAIEAGFWPLKVDLTNPGEAENALAQRFEVTAIPTLILLRSDGTVIKKHTGVMGADQFLAWLGGVKPEAP
jgi:thiol:disulfide interchange protein